MRNEGGMRKGRAPLDALATVFATGRLKQKVLLHQTGSK
jgi:hypothetical protein